MDWREALQMAKKDFYGLVLGALLWRLLERGVIARFKVSVPAGKRYIVLPVGIRFKGDEVVKVRFDTKTFNVELVGGRTRMSVAEIDNLRDAQELYDLVNDAIRQLVAMRSGGDR